MYAQKISVLQEQADGQLAKFEIDLVKTLRADSKRFLKEICDKFTCFEPDDTTAMIKRLEDVMKDED